MWTTTPNMATQADLSFPLFSPTMTQNTALNLTRWTLTAMPRTLPRKKSQELAIQVTLQALNMKATAPAATTTTPTPRTMMVR